MKRYLQCAEQHCLPSNITKYCACHEILSSRCQRKIPELLPPIQERFEDNPTMIRTESEHKIVISHPPLRRHYSSHLGGAFCMEKYSIWRSGYLQKFQPQKVTLQLHRILRLPRKAALRYCTLSYSTLSYSTLSYSALSYSALSYCTLSYSTLSNSSLSYSTLSYSTLSYCTLSYSTLSYSTLSYSTLSYSTLSYSSLSYSTLSYSTLSYSTLSYSTLSNSTLSYSTLSCLF